MKIAILTNPSPMGHTPQPGQPYDTPFGPSAAIARLPLGSHDVFVCAPESADPRATVRALKELGATHLWLCESVAALSPLLEVGDWLIPDDYIDGTRGQHYTYFSEKAGGYTQQVPPFDPASREALIGAVSAQHPHPFKRGVYVCVSSTRLETPAEAAFWSRAGAHVAGRFLSPYLPLARELEMQVAVLARVMRVGGAAGESVPLRTYLDVVSETLARLEPSDAEVSAGTVELPRYPVTTIRTDPLPQKAIERFTQGAERALKLAHVEAESLQQNVIGVEHLLLGIMREEHGLGGRALRAMDVEYPLLKAAVEANSKPSDRAPDTRLELSMETKKALKAAIAEARRLDNRFVGTAHLLLGIAADENTSASSILQNLGGITPIDVRQRVKRMIEQEEGSQHPAERSQSTMWQEARYMVMMNVLDKASGATKTGVGMPIPLVEFRSEQLGKILELEDIVGYRIEIYIIKRDEWQGRARPEPTDEPPDDPPQEPEE